ncbi:MAG: aminoacyl-tRNA hydrolase [bacterium]|nr:aminoacyl-tRNA hydrolase [bacterium]
MKCIIGLGNPGTRYADTRHNSGAMVLSSLVKHGDSPFQVNRKLKATIGSIRGANEALLAVPTTYMNNSGEAVRSILQYYKLKPADLWLIYDDIDIEFGRIRIKPYGSSAGHNGVTSVIEAVGTDDFARFRVGIKLSDEEAKEAQYAKLTTARFVLLPFSKEQKKILPSIIDETRDAILLALEKGLPEAMNKYN